MNRLRWVDALECMADGPHRDLLHAVGRVLTRPTDRALTDLGHAADAVVSLIIDAAPIDVAVPDRLPANDHSLTGHEHPDLCVAGMPVALPDRPGAVL